MKKHIVLFSSLMLAVLMACDNSSSSNDDEPVATNSGGNAAAPDSGVPVSDTETTTGEANGEGAAPPTSPTGEVQTELALNSTNLEFTRLQYDCGDIATPLDPSFVETKLTGAKSFLTLAATIPAKDKALLEIATEENGRACTYRALFAVNKAFTEVTFEESQALNPSALSDCLTSKSAIDLGFGSKPIAFDYDKKFIRWVALHIPIEMQKDAAAAPVCPSGKLRAVFAGPSV